MTILNHWIIAALRLMLVATVLTLASQARAQSTAFTYQGRLSDGVNAANGNYDFRFAIYDLATGGAVLGGPLTNIAVAVSNGLFTVSLDFGAGIFTGADRWLEIGVRSNGGVAPFILLSPRQPLTAAPYAIYAAGANAAGLSGNVPAANLGGNYSNTVILTNPNNAFSGNGAGLTNVNAASLSGQVATSFWQTGGNSGTTPGVNFIGTSDNKVLEFRANNQRVLLLDGIPSAPNIVGGHSGNSIGGGASGVTIAGGGDDGLSGYDLNRVNSSRGTIGGGAAGYIGTNSPAGTIAGGFQSFIGDNADHSSIGGGRGNGISAGAYQSVIAGGLGNTLEEFAVRCTISGGVMNRIGQTNFSATIAGGQNNTISSKSFYSVISGGYLNQIVGQFSDSVVIGGGKANVIDTSDGAVISGGLQNRLWNAPSANIGGGRENWIDGAPGATLSGGSDNKIEPNAPYATIPGGSFARASSYGQLAYSGGSFGNWGDSQTSIYVLRGVTTNAALTELFLEGAVASSVSNRMIVPVNGVWTFDILVVATTAVSSQVAGYQIKGLVSNQAGALTLFGVVATPLYEDVGAWDASAVADSAHGALGLLVRGGAVTTVRWVASVRTVEVIH